MTSTGLPGLPQDEFTRRFVGTCMLVRLLAVLAALVGMVGQVVTLPVLACTVAISVSSLCVLLSPAVSTFIGRHPLVLVLDVLLSLAVLAALGVESPLVLATLSTALVVGLAFPPVTAALCGVVLVAGYSLLAVLNGVTPDRFMVALGIPALYVGLIVVGGALRRTHAAQVLAADQLAEARGAAAAAEERARLAREMHDSVGKTLHGIALGADALPTLVERDPASARLFARELSEGARRGAKEARQLLVRLRADQPDRPLVEVLRERCAAWSEVAGVPCDFQAEGVVDLPVESRYEVLAILGEALENVRRHARAATVAVALRAEAGGAVRLSVRDDGEGFVPRADGGSPEGHFGLTGMAERARAAGLSVRVESTLGAGTTVTVVSTREVASRAAVPALDDVGTTHV